MNGKSFIYGLLIGGTVASISTLLSTPASGAAARAKVKRAKDNIRVTVEELKQEALIVKGQVTQAVEEGKTTVGSLCTDLKSSIELWQNTIEPHKETIQQNIAEVEKELEKLEKNLPKKES